MKDKFKDLNDTFDVEAEIVKPEKEERKEITKPSESEDVTKDYEYTRGNLYSIIEKGQDALSGALDVATNTDHPRAYEVTGQLIKSVSDATEKLIDLQKKMQDIEEGPKSKQKITNNNAVFVGTNAQLGKLIKQGILDNK